MTDIAEQLSTPVPYEYVSQRSGGGGIKLDYVSGRYVKQRLNELFGWDGWSMEILDKQLFPEECTAFVHLRLRVVPQNEQGQRLFGQAIVRDGMAYGHGRKGAEGFDFAIAEAVTDALKRAAVTLGQNLGLSLYPMSKGSKVDPAAHSIADTPQSRPKPPSTNLADSFADRIGQCTNATELEQVGAQMAHAGLKEEEKQLLRHIYAKTKERLSA